MHNGWLQTRPWPGPFLNAGWSWRVGVDEPHEHLLIIIIYATTCHNRGQTHLSSRDVGCPLRWRPAIPPSSVRVMHEKGNGRNCTYVILMERGPRLTPSPTLRTIARPRTPPTCQKGGMGEQHQGPAAADTARIHLGGVPAAHLSGVNHT